jgi:hypothetical protein
VLIEHCHVFTSIGIPTALNPLWRKESLFCRLIRCKFRFIYTLWKFALATFVVETARESWLRNRPNAIGIIEA